MRRKRERTKKKELVSSVKWVVPIYRYPYPYERDWVNPISYQTLTLCLDNDVGGKGREGKGKKAERMRKSSPCLIGEKKGEEKKIHFPSTSFHFSKTLSINKKNKELNPYRSLPSKSFFSKIFTQTKENASLQIPQFPYPIVLVKKWFKWIPYMNLKTRTTYPLKLQNQNNQKRQNPLFGMLKLPYSSFYALIPLKKVYMY